MKDATYPGMYPALETSPLFHMFHTLLMTEILRQIIPKLPEGYDAYLEMSVALESAEREQRKVPDAHVSYVARDAEVAYATAPAPNDGPSFVLEAPEPISPKLRSVHLKDRSNNLISTIEVLSPSNKYGVGFQKFKEKQATLYTNGVHLVEIDLLRRGFRRLEDERVKNATYVCSVTNCNVGKTSVWTFGTDQPLPILDIPLRSGDPMVPLLLQPAYNATFSLGRFAQKLTYEASTKGSS